MELRCNDEGVSPLRAETCFEGSLIDFSQFYEYDYVIHFYKPVVR